MKIEYKYRAYEDEFGPKNIEIIIGDNEDVVQINTTGGVTIYLTIDEIIQSVKCFTDLVAIMPIRLHDSDEEVTEIAESIGDSDSWLEEADFDVIEDYADLLQKLNRLKEQLYIVNKVFRAIERKRGIKR